MKDVWSGIEETVINRKINKKKITITIIIILTIIFLTTVYIVYKTNENAREWTDKKIFRKEVLQDNVVTIDIGEGNVKNIYAFNKYIGILDKTKFRIYNNVGDKEKEIDIQISNPIFSSENRFLAIAEKKGQKLYVIENKEILWEATVEGNISQIHINKNGYVAVVITDTSYKTVIKMYNSQGKPIFKNYLSSTAIDISISNDNKYLAMAEVDTTGTIIQSNIKIVSIDKASKEENDWLEKTYKCESGKLITNIKYQNKNRLVCMFTDSIDVIEHGEIINLEKNVNKKITFQSINLLNYACVVEEKSLGVFTADSQVELINIENKEIKEYIAKSVTKEIYTYGDVLALNLGTEIELINTSGWLVKRYIANQEITNIVISDSIAGIIYKDKIEIINL